MRRNFPVTNGRLASREMCTEYVNALLGNVMKNQTEKESKKNEDVNFFTLGNVCLWNELDEILIYWLDCYVPVTNRNLKWKNV